MRRVLACLLALAVPPAATAEMAEVRLLSGWRAEGTHLAGLEIELAPDWHTYWRVPGATGIAPAFDWSGSKNLAAVQVIWPHPEVFESFGMRTIGYHDHVVLPLMLTPVDPAAPIALDVVFTYGVCKDICMPAEVRLRETLTPAPGDGRGAIEAALARGPQRAEEAGVLETACRLAPNGRGHDLTATVRLRTAPSAPPVAVIEAARPDVWIGEATSRTEGGVVTAEAKVETAAPALMLDRDGLRVTLIGADRTVAIEGCPAPR